MSATRTATMTSGLSAVVTFTGPYVSPQDNTDTISGLSETVTLSGTTSPAVSKGAAFQLAMTGGSATIDLTALPGQTADETVNGTGLKVQFLKVRNLAANANPVTVGKGASNGYGLDAAGDTWSQPLSPGQSALYNLDGAAPTISGTAKLIGVAGTGSQVVEVQVEMG